MPLSVIAVLVLVAVTAVAVRVMSADADGCSSSSGVQLTVAAAPEIAPAVQDAATAWGQTDPEVNGKCIQVEVRAVTPADLAASLATRVGGHIDVAAKPAPTPSDGDIPAVWIPDSASWLARVTAVDRSAFGSSAPVVATSPIVFAMPASLATAMASKLGDTGGKGVLREALADAAGAIKNQRAPELAVGIVDPRRDAASLGGAILLRDAIVTDETKVPDLIAVYRLINRRPVPDAASLPQAFEQGVKVAPMAEQAVLAFNAINPSAPLAAIPQDPGGPGLDYPYATLSGKPREVETAAAKFRAALTGGEYRVPFIRRGFRSPDGASGPGFPAGGIPVQTVNTTPLDNPTRVGQTLGLWSAANAPSRALALIDRSLSMGNPLAGTTRMGVLKESAISGLELFTDTSALGLWTFTSTHAELAPILELSRANRDLLKFRIGGVGPSGENESALFLAFRDAYKAMTDNHNPEVANRLIVLTDGTTSSPGIKNLEQLKRELEAISVVTKPIKVTLIGIGDQVNMDELNAIADMVGGLARQIRDPSQIRSVFLSALLE